ncbi:MAG: DUF3368 domain-containing protein [Parasporobacterium sp.]|nr:DUF3368 domain-containing protein [Parasporobacterium sp.]
MRKVVVNTTPIIALSDIGYLHLLKKLYGEIIIPQAVYDEILSEPALSDVKMNRDWIRVEKIQDTSQKKMYKARLHAGEVEVMILAQEKNADLVIIDDNTAKKTAKYLGLTVTGTLGVLLKCKSSGYIEEVKPVLEKLEDNGLYISSSVKEYVLELAAE